MDVFFGAGVLFISEDEQSVLTGFHPKLNRWSGFGGKSQENEKPLQTAVREVIEEIFGIFSLSNECFTEISTCVTDHPQNEGGYIVFIEPISTLFKMAEVLRKKNYKSEYYLEIPSTTSELFNTRYFSIEMEISRLEFFLLKDLQDRRGSLTQEFYQDIQKFCFLSAHEYTDELLILEKLLEDFNV